jgi:hypothetical protein
MRRELRLVIVLCLARVWLASGASAAPPAYQSLFDGLLLDTVKEDELCVPSSLVGG